MPLYPQAPPNARQEAPFSSHWGLSRDVYPLTHLTEELFLLRVANANTRPRGHILLLHGLTWSSHLYDVDYLDYSLCDYLAHEGYAVWLLDFAGYGQSSLVSNGFDVDTRHAVQEVILAANFIRVHEGVEKIDLMGLSWGAVVAGVFAAEHPDKVNRLVFYSPLLVGLGESVVDNPFFYPSWQVAADEFQRDPVGNIDQELHDMAAVNTFIADCWRHEKEVTPNGGRRDVHVSRETRLIPVDAIRAPTLILYGELDTHVDAEAAAWAVDALPEGSKLVTFPQSFVFVHLERPNYRTFRETLLGFLEGEQP